MKALAHPASGPIASIAALAWGLAVIGGFLAFHANEATPGHSGQAVPHWPAGSRLAPDRDRPTLVMAAHPFCPCTRASAAELARLLARCEGQLAVHVLIFTPRHADSSWSRSGCSRSFAAIPGVHATDDPEGVEARRFGARTSGQVALYAPDGRLLFRGGMTRGRGQEGDNLGRETILSLLRGNSGPPPETPVFGCPIF